MLFHAVLWLGDLLRQLREDLSAAAEDATTWPSTQQLLAQLDGALEMAELTAGAIARHPASTLTPIVGPLEPLSQTEYPSLSVIPRYLFVLPFVTVTTSLLVLLGVALCAPMYAVQTFWRRILGAGSSDTTLILPTPVRIVEVLHNGRLLLRVAMEQSAHRMRNQPLVRRSHGVISRILVCWPICILSAAAELIGLGEQSILNPFEVAESCVETTVDLGTRSESSNFEGELTSSGTSTQLLDTVEPQHHSQPELSQFSPSIVNPPITESQESSPQTFQQFSPKSGKTSLERGNKLFKLDDECDTRQEPTSSSLQSQLKILEKENKTTSTCEESSSPKQGAILNPDHTSPRRGHSQSESQVSPTPNLGSPQGRTNFKREAVSPEPNFRSPKSRTSPGLGLISSNVTKHSILGLISSQTSSSSSSAGSQKSSDEENKSIGSKTTHGMKIGYSSKHRFKNLFRRNRSASGMSPECESKPLTSASDLAGPSTAVPSRTSLPERSSPETLLEFSHSERSSPMSCTESYSIPSKQSTSLSSSPPSTLSSSVPSMISLSQRSPSQLLELFFPPGRPASPIMFSELSPLERSTSVAPSSSLDTSRQTIHSPVHVIQRPIPVRGFLQRSPFSVSVSPTLESSPHQSTNTSSTCAQSHISRQPDSSVCPSSSHFTDITLLHPHSSTSRGRPLSEHLQSPMRPISSLQVLPSRGSSLQNFGSISYFASIPVGTTESCFHILYRSNSAPALFTSSGTPLSSDASASSSAPPRSLAIGFQSSDELLPSSIDLASSAPDNQSSGLNILPQDAVASTSTERSSSSDEPEPINSITNGFTPFTDSMIVQDINIAAISSSASLVESDQSDGTGEKSTDCVVENSTSESYAIISSELDSLVDGGWHSVENRPELQVNDFDRPSAHSMSDKEEEEMTETHHRETQIEEEGPRVASGLDTFCVAGQGPSHEHPSELLPTADVREQPLSTLCIQLATSDSSCLSEAPGPSESASADDDSHVTSHTPAAEQSEEESEGKGMETQPSEELLRTASEISHLEEELLLAAEEEHDQPGATEPSNASVSSESEGLSAREVVHQSTLAVAGPSHGSFFQQVPSLSSLASLASEMVAITAPKHLQEQQHQTPCTVSVKEQEDDYDMRSQHEYDAHHEKVHKNDSLKNTNKAGQLQSTETESESVSELSEWSFGSDDGSIRPKLDQEIGEMERSLSSQLNLDAVEEEEVDSTELLGMSVQSAGVFGSLPEDETSEILKGDPENSS